jgi:hypothetical protein
MEQAGFSNRVVKTLSTGAAGIYKVSALASKKKIILYENTTNHRVYFS